MSITVTRVPVDALGPCFALRRAVFVVEQGVPEEIEIDGLDPECLHVAARDAQGEIIGTARLRPREAGVAKIERVCVSPAHRGTGVGAALVDALETEAAEAGYAELVLSAQAEVIPFYAKRGYVGEGERFMEAGIEHLYMRKRPPNPR